MAEKPEQRSDEQKVGGNIMDEEFNPELPTDTFVDCEDVVTELLGVATGEQEKDKIDLPSLDAASLSTQEREQTPLGTSASHPEDSNREQETPVDKKEKINQEKQNTTGTSGRSISLNLIFPNDSPLGRSDRPRLTCQRGNCKSTPISFRTVKNLSDHIALYHSDDKPPKPEMKRSTPSASVICNLTYCKGVNPPSTFRTPSDYSQHLRICHGVYGHETSPSRVSESPSRISDSPSRISQDSYSDFSKGLGSSDGSKSEN